MNQKVGIDFVKYRSLTALFSLSILSAFAGLCLYRYNTRGEIFTYSIDFTGGTQVLFKFDKPISTIKLKNILEKKGWAGAITREFSESEILVRVKGFSNDAKGLGDQIRKEIHDELPEYTIDVLQSESVGPGIGQALRWKSVRAVLFALIAMLIYIAIRFLSFAYALGAVMALFHDALIMLGTFLLLDREISINVIGAMLAVLGYSINDTIVIFSQIRDNIKSMGSASLSDVVNVSINHMLRRTVLTSISTGLAVGAMFVLGGEALRDFSLVLLVGIVFGTYSSVYIASPVMMLLYRRKQQ